MLSIETDSGSKIIQILDISCNRELSHENFETVETLYTIISDRQVFPEIDLFRNIWISVSRGIPYAVLRTNQKACNRSHILLIISKVWTNTVEFNHVADILYHWHIKGVEIACCGEHHLRFVDNMNWMSIVTIVNIKHYGQCPSRFCSSLLRFLLMNTFDRMSVSKIRVFA
jgi:hypothetical protein